MANKDEYTGSRICWSAVYIKHNGVQGGGTKRRRRAVVIHVPQVAAFYLRRAIKKIAS